MTDYNDGKIHGWNGGDCPVHPETEVLVWLRNGEIQDRIAYGLTWGHLKSCSDIIAFQVVEAYAEPKVMWLGMSKHRILALIEKGKAE